MKDNSLKGRTLKLFGLKFKKSNCTKVNQRVGCVLGEGIHASTVTRGRFWGGSEDRAFHWRKPGDK